MPAEGPSVADGIGDMVLAAHTGGWGAGGPQDPGQPLSEAHWWPLSLWTSATLPFTPSANRLFLRSEPAVHVRWASTWECQARPRCWKRRPEPDARAPALRGQRARQGTGHRL